MTPFMLRLLDAELPLYCREADIALDRLFLLKESCEKVHTVVLQFPLVGVTIYAYL